MATDYEAINAAQRAFIEAQHVFFVASAPLSGEGHINMSPKGLDSFRVLGPNRVAYLDLTTASPTFAVKVLRPWTSITGGLLARTSGLLVPAPRAPVSEARTTSSI